MVTGNMGVRAQDATSVLFVPRTRCHHEISNQSKCGTHVCSCPSRDLSVVRAQVATSAKCKNIINSSKTYIIFRNLEFQERGEEMRLDRVFFRTRLVIAEVHC